MIRARGIVFTEHAILLGVITAALLGMQLYAKRGLQAGVKAAADQLSPFGFVKDPQGKQAQAMGLDYESGERRNSALELPGQVITRESAVRTESTITQRVVGRATASGAVVTTTYPTETTTTSGAVTGRPGVSQYSEVIAGLSSRGD